MMEALFEAETAQVLATWLANQVLVGGTLILAGAGAVTCLLGGASAARRHAVWLLGVMGLLAAPFLSVARGPAVADAGVAPAPPARSVPAPTPAPSLAAVEAPAPVRVPRTPLPVVPEAWLWIWAGGALVGLIRLSSGRRRADLLVSQAAPAPHGLRAFAAELGAGIGLTRDVRILTHEDVPVPLTIGALRPAVLLPADATEWSADALRSALLHELAHVSRLDYAGHIAAQIAFALYWPVPLTWWARVRLERERERACDDRVLSWGTSATDYAQHLVDVARSAPWAWGTAAALGGRGTLDERVDAVLEGRPRRPWSRPALVATGAVAAVVSLLAAGIHPLPTRWEARRGEALRELQSEGAAVRRHGAWMLGELESRRDAGALILVTGDDDPGVRATAAWALGEIKDPSTIPAVAALLSDENRLVREMAVLALGEIEDEAALPTLLDLLDSDQTLDAAVAWSIAEIGGGASAGTAGLARRWTRSDLWSGGAEGAAPRRSFSTGEALQALASPDPGMRRAAALALGRASAEEAVDSLLDALADTDPGVRAAAVWALDEINPSRS